MNTSMKLVLEDSEKSTFKLGELGFILTVLRDNTSDDYVYEVLNNLIKNSSDLK